MRIRILMYEHILSSRIRLKINWKKGCVIFKQCSVGKQTYVIKVKADCSVKSGWQRSNWDFLISSIRNHDFSPNKRVSPLPFKTSFDLQRSFNHSYWQTTNRIARKVSQYSWRCNLYRLARDASDAQRHLQTICRSRIMANCWRNRQVSSSRTGNMPKIFI